MIATVDEARLHSEESEDVLVKLVGPVEVTGGESHFDLPAATCDRKMGLDSTMKFLAQHLNVCTKVKIVFDRQLSKN